MKLIAYLLIFIINYFINRWIIASVTHDDNLAFTGAFVLTSIEMAFQSVKEKLDALAEKK